MEVRVRWLGTKLLDTCINTWTCIHYSDSPVIEAIVSPSVWLTIVGLSLTSISIPLTERPSNLGLFKPNSIILRLIHLSIVDLMRLSNWVL